MKAEKDIFRKKYESFGIPTPKVHFVLGSLLGAQLEDLSKKYFFSRWTKKGRILFSEVPELKTASAPNHLAHYDYFYHQEKKISICFQAGRLHGYEGWTPKQVAQTVIGPRQAGTEIFILSNISGGLRKDLTAGSVVAIRDHINFTGSSPLIGLTKDKDFYFLDMAHAYNPVINSWVKRHIKKKKINIKNGTYIGVLGPQFETPAEVNMFRNLGADVVGMSTIWEVIALHYLKAQIGAFSIVANPACGVGDSVKIDTTALKPCFSAVIESFLDFAESLIMHYEGNFLLGIRDV